MAPRNFFVHLTFLAIQVHFIHCAGNLPIPIRKCCSEGYVLNFNGTSAKNPSCEASSTRSTFWPLRVVNRFTNQIERTVNTNWTFSYGKPNCSLEDTELYYTRDLYANDSQAVLYDTGHLYLKYHQIFRKREHFCIDEASKSGRLFPIVRYCVHDLPQSVTINKCCPVGWAMNSSTSECNIRYSTPLRIDFIKEQELPDPIVQYSLGFPYCQRKLHRLNPEYTPDDFFSFTRRGKINPPLLPNQAPPKVEGYCIDYSFDRVSLPSRTNALLCSPDYKENSAGTLHPLLLTTWITVVAVMLI